MAIPEGPDVLRVTTRSGTLRVRVVGEGPPVLLIHSLLLDPDLYADVAPRLVSAGWRCVIPELPLGGHLLPVEESADLTPSGLAQLLVEVLDALALDRVDVVGVDTGGALAQLLMADHRERVGKVMLTACDAYEEFPPTTLVGRAFVPLFWPGVTGLAAQALRLRVFRKLVTLRPITHRGVDDPMIKRWVAPLRDSRVRLDVRRAFRAMAPEYTLAAAEQNRDFPRPVLVAWGDDARLFRRSLADRLVRDLPHARLVVLQDCAAFAALDQPAELARLVDEHLRSSV